MRGDGASYVRRDAGLPAIEPGMPTPAQTELKDLAKRKRPKTKVRPQTDWLEVPQPALAEFLSKQLNVSPLLAQCLLNRGFSEPEPISRFLDPRLANDSGINHVKMTAGPFSGPC